MSASVLCPRCGAPLGSGAAFCSQCGLAQGPVLAPIQPRRPKVVLWIVVGVSATVAVMMAVFALIIATRPDPPVYSFDSQTDGTVEAGVPCIVGVWDVTNYVADFSLDGTTRTQSALGPGLRITINADGTGRDDYGDGVRLISSSGTEGTLSGTVDWRWSVSGDRVRTTDATAHMTVNGSIPITGPQPGNSGTFICAGNQLLVTFTNARFSAQRH